MHIIALKTKLLEKKENIPLCFKVLDNFRTIVNTLFHLISYSFLFVSHQQLFKFLVHNHESIAYIYCWIQNSANIHEPAHFVCFTVLLQFFLQEFFFFFYCFLFIEIFFRCIWYRKIEVDHGQRTRRVWVSEIM